LAVSHGDESVQSLVASDVCKCLGRAFIDMGSQP
jgi:hypothetical protein